MKVNTSRNAVRGAVGNAARWVAMVLLAFVQVFAVARAQPGESLDRLFDLLREAPDMVSAQVIEQKIWQSWLTPNDADADTLLRRGMSAGWTGVSLVMRCRCSRV